MKNEDKNQANESTDSLSPTHGTDFNAVLLLLYDLTIAKAPVSPLDCREIADKVVWRMSNIKSQIKALLGTLETIDTTKLAAKGLYNEAEAISTARVRIDRLIGIQESSEQKG